MTDAGPPTKESVPYLRIGPERAALALAMAVVVAAAMIRQAPNIRQTGKQARVEARLLTARAQTRLVSFYAWLEAQGYETSSRLMDVTGFPGERASQALAEAAVSQYEYAIFNGSADWKTRANAAILYGYLGKDHEGVLVLQEGLSVSRLPQYWFLFRVYGHEAPKQAWLKSAELPALRSLPAGPLLMARLHRDLGQPQKANRDLQAGFRRSLNLLAVFCSLAVLGIAGLGVWAGFLALRPWRKPAAVQEAAWSVYQAVEVLIVWLFVSLMIGWAAGAVFRGAPLSPALFATGIYVVTGGAALAWFIVLSMRQGGRSPSGLGWRSGRGVLAGIAGYCATLPVLAAVWVVMRAVMSDPTPASPALPVVAGATGLLDRILVIALAMLLAPIFEETLFRGIVYGALRRRMRPGLAMTVSGVVFGLAHLDLVGALPLVALGIVLAYLYERTGSLVAPAVAHGLINAGTVALTMVV